MANKWVRIVGFYDNEFINQDALITDAEDDIAMSLLKEKFRGAIVTIVKQVKPARAICFLPKQQRV